MDAPERRSPPRHSDYNLVNPRDIKKLDELANIENELNSSGFLLSLSGLKPVKWKKKDNLEKITPLMQRVFDGYLRIDDKHTMTNIRGKIIAARAGLEVLKVYCKEKGNFKKFNQIQSIIDDIQSKLTSSEGFDRQRTKKVNNTTYVKLKKLASSMDHDSNTGVSNREHGVNFLLDRIHQFKLLEQHNHSSVENDFLDFLYKAVKLSIRLDLSCFEDILYAESLAGRIDLPKEIKKLSEEFIQDFDIKSDDAKKMAVKSIKEGIVNEFLIHLDEMPEKIQSQIGIQVVMRWQIEGIGGHIFGIGICKEIDGSYTAIQSNAGAFALGLEEQKYHWNINYPISKHLHTVVEFKGLTRVEAMNLMIWAGENVDANISANDEVENRYALAFEPFMHKMNIEGIPLRRGQITENCGVKITEMLVFSFQKAGFVDIGNKFLSYVDFRDSSTLPFEKIKPLKSASPRK